MAGPACTAARLATGPPTKTRWIAWAAASAASTEGKTTKDRGGPHHRVISGYEVEEAHSAERPGQFGRTDDVGHENGHGPDFLWTADAWPLGDPVEDAVAHVSR